MPNLKAEYKPIVRPSKTLPKCVFYSPKQLLLLAKGRPHEN